ncbi:DUF2247 family protein [Pseudoalteromonas viridis]|uniref:DUF2247 family protein n=1 Tax=Pseudoalteromonas viridis TaxID=339617 RepID=A0ABX7V8Z1_9GAMM|nr:DUF2247 family protein [Pseudoalteromonas viridis]QTL37373.1 DUF2247 family protein [Pseudoalteromonas viridis]
MPPIKILKNLSLLCWSTILLGLKKGWASREDAIDYAMELLVNGSEDEGVVLIAGGETLEDGELFNLISDKVEKTDIATALDKWRLAYLLNIASSDDHEQIKLDKLQEVYANFDYPEDMASCSIYSQGEIDPLIAMMQVVEVLKNELAQC